MKLRAYDHERDFDALQQWDTGLRMHMMWCAGRFPYPPEREHFAEALRAVCGQTGDQPYVAENETAMRSASAAFPIMPECVREC